MSTTCLDIPNILESLDEEVKPLHEFRRRWHGARYVLEKLVRVVGSHVISQSFHVGCRFFHRSFAFWNRAESGIVNASRRWARNG